MTNEQVYDPQLALRQRIAGILDRPSVYMGGPSKQNLKRAEEIIAAIREDSRLMQALQDEPTRECERLRERRPYEGAEVCHERPTTKSGPDHRWHWIEADQKWQCWDCCHEIRAENREVPHE